MIVQIVRELPSGLREDGWVSAPPGNLLARLWRRMTRGGPKVRWLRGSDLAPDARVYLDRDGDLVPVTVEVSNASFRRGGRARDRIDCRVNVVAERGWVIVWSDPRPWPRTWPRKRATFRRGCAYPVNRPDLAAEAHARATGSFCGDWRARRVRFGPLNMPLPNLSSAQRAHFQSVYLQKEAQLKASLATGATGFNLEGEDEDGLPHRSVPNNSNFALGKWEEWFPWGPISRDAPAGAGIQHWRAWIQDLFALKTYFLALAPVHERALHAYDRDTGDPVTADWYPYGTLDYSPGSNDPNNDELPEERGTLGQDPLPEDYDQSHRIRGDGIAIAVAEMTDDPFAKFVIRERAAHSRLQFTERGRGPQPGHAPSNLRTWIDTSPSQPGQGSFGTQAGRTLGWAAWIQAENAKLNGWVDGNRAWVDALINFTNYVAPPHGICQRVRHSQPPAGQTDSWYDPNSDLAQSFEAAIYWPAVAAAAIQRDGTVDAVRQPLFAAARNLYDGSLPILPYGAGSQGPPHFLHVASRLGPVYDVLFSGVGGGDPAHAETFLSLMIREDPTGPWRGRSTRYGGPSSTWITKRNFLESTTSFGILGWAAGLLAQYQRG